MKWVSYQTMLGVMIQAPFPLGDLTLNLFILRDIVHIISGSQEWLSLQCWQCSSPTGQIFSWLARQSHLSRLLSYCLGLRQPPKVHKVLGWFDLILGQISGNLSSQVFLWFLIPESPRWLLAKNKYNCTNTTYRYFEWRKNADLSFSLCFPGKKSTPPWWRLLRRKTGRNWVLSSSLSWHHIRLSSAKLVCVAAEI